MMYLSTTNKNETIKSNELVEIINQFRQLEGGKAELQHSDFMKKIRKEVEMLELLGLIVQGNFSSAKYYDEQARVESALKLLEMVCSKC